MCLYHHSSSSSVYGGDYRQRHLVFRIRGILDRRLQGSVSEGGLQCRDLGRGDDRAVLASGRGITVAGAMVLAVGVVSTATLEAPALLREDS